MLGRRTRVAVAAVIVSFTLACADKVGVEEIAVARSFTPKFGTISSSESTGGSHGESGYIEYAVRDLEVAREAGFATPSGIREIGARSSPETGWTTWAEYKVRRKSDDCIVSIQGFIGPGDGVSPPDEEVLARGDVVRVTAVCGY